MPIKYSILTVLLLLVCHRDMAAYNDDDPRFEFFIMIGTNGQKNPMGTLENFRKMAPGSSLLKNPLNTHYLMNEMSDGSLFLLGFQRNPESGGKRPAFRLAFGFGNGTFMEAEHKSVSYFRMDTLTSSKTGQQFFIDSAVYEQYKFSHRATISTIDYSAIWRTSNHHKMKVFTGIGISYGTSVSEVTTLTYSNYSVINYYPYYGQRVNYNLQAYETHEQKMQTFASLYCPFGLDYNLSKKESSFWNKLHLFLESRAQVYYKKIPELGKSIQTRMQIGFGLRMKFER